MKHIHITVSDDEFYDLSKKKLIIRSRSWRDFIIKGTSGIKNGAVKNEA